MKYQFISINFVMKNALVDQCIPGPDFFERCVYVCVYVLVPRLFVTIYLCKELVK